MVDSGWAWSRFSFLLASLDTREGSEPPQELHLYTLNRHGMGGYLPLVFHAAWLAGTAAA